MIGLFNIHPLTIPVFIIMGFTPYKRYFFSLYFFIFLHELTHMAVSLFLKEKVSSVSLYPWGCSLNLASFPGRRNTVLILLAGPLFNLFMYFLSIYPKENLSLAIFNLFPVMPLDGGGIVNALFGKRAFFVSLSFTIITIILCFRFHLPPHLPIALAVILITGEKNRIDKNINFKITAFFKGEK